MKSSDPEDAISEFLGIPPLEKEKGDWGFKGLKQAIKLEFKLGQYEKVCANRRSRSLIELTRFRCRQSSTTWSSSHTSSRP